MNEPVGSTVDSHAHSLTWRLPLLLLAFVIVTGMLQGSSFEAALTIGTGFVPFGFALMAVLALYGDRQASARPLALVLLAGTVAALSMGSLALVVLHVVQPGSLGQSSSDVSFVTNGEARLGFMVLLTAVGAAATLLALFRSVREALRDVIPLDTSRFSHAIALSAAVAVSVLPLLPLFVLGRPPLPIPDGVLPPGTSPVVLPTFAERSFELGWFALATLLVAGPGASRTWRELLARLGLRRPAVWHIALAILLGVTLALARPRIAAALATWTTVTPQGLPDPWLPVPASWTAVLGLSLLTATGCELTYRGLLQPRLGLVLTNIIVAAPLAWTSNWPSLFLLFCLGMGLGALRLLGGTVASWLAHVAFLFATGWPLLR